MGAEQLYRSLGIAAAVGLGLCALVCVALSLRWPFMGDSTYMHYVVRLMHFGMRPYADVLDMDMPGTFLLEDTAIRLFGDGALGWHLYDLLLTGLSALLMSRLAQTPVAGWLAGAALLVLHAQDGVMMPGERDYAIMLFALVAAWAITRTIENDLLWPALAGLALGAAASIKPTALAFALPLLWWISLRRIRPLASLLVATAIAPALCLLWMHHLGVVTAFWTAMHTITPYHTTFSRKPLGFLITHCISPIGAVVAVWIVGLALTRKADRRMQLLYLCMLAGWICYAAQRKGFGYHRYPMLAFVLTAIASHFTAWLRREDRIRFVGVAGSLLALGMGIYFTVRVAHYSHARPEAAMAASIARNATDGTLQCMDSAGPCIAALESLHWRQATGSLYDCYMLSDTAPASLALRQRYMQMLAQNPPGAFLISDGICYDGQRGFDKYSNWPQFTALLHDHYRLAEQQTPTQPVRYWNRSEVPYAWRVYVRTN